MQEIKHAYSPSERRLLDLIKYGQKISTSELLEGMYEGEYEPFHGRGSVNATLSDLIRKVDLNREPFVIRKSARRGPYPVSVWREKRR
jgi:hypothetical protein